MNVAFIPTAYRTPIFHGIAERLGRNGHQVFWLSPNRRWAVWLVERGVPADRILDVTIAGPQWVENPQPTPQDLDRLEALEQAGTLKVRDIVSMDPLLRRRQTDYAVRYLAVCAGLVTDFLRTHDIRLVLGEQTWAFELLTGQIARSLHIDHLMPHTVRIPDQRFGFFNGPREDDLVAIESVGDEHRAEASRVLEDFRAREPEPSYMSINRSVVRADTGRLRLLARHARDVASDPYDETTRRVLPLMADHTQQILRRQRNLRSRLLEDPGDDLPEPYVYFPLHLQPEASIDIKGAPYTNQIEIVRAMSRTLPVRHQLLVKEHGVALIRRRRGFYQALAGIPGVRLIHPGADSFHIGRRAALTSTITGTAAYEAALLGRPAATIAPIFFDPIVEHPRFDPFRDRLDEALASPNRRVADEDRIELLARVIASSFPGVVGDALWQPGTDQPEMLDRVAAGFLRLLECRDERGES